LIAVRKFPGFAISPPSLVYQEMLVIKFPKWFSAWYNFLLHSPCMVYRWLCQTSLHIAKKAKEPNQGKPFKGIVS
jgi:hypothetical protein